MTDTAAIDSSELSANQHVERQHSVAGRLILLFGIVASVSVCTWLAKTFSIPNDRGFSVSLVQQPHWPISLFVVLLAMVIAVFVAGTITRPLRPEAALLCAALGVASISLRGGPMQAVLFDAAGAGVFVGLAVEVLILFAFLAAADVFYSQFKPLPAGAATRPSDAVLAIFAHAAAMTATMMLVCRSDAKMQTLVSVGLCAGVAAYAARQIVPTDTLGWLWLSPLIVSLLGYFIAWGHPESMQIGVLHGAFAPLARPLPLDYVGMGTAGTIVGYWMATPAAEDDADADGK